jgi:hypothetical protein
MRNTFRPGQIAIAGAIFDTVDDIVNGVDVVSGIYEKGRTIVSKVSGFYNRIFPGGSKAATVTPEPVMVGYKRKRTASKSRPKSKRYRKVAKTSRWKGKRSKTPYRKTKGKARKTFATKSMATKLAAKIAVQDRWIVANSSRCIAGNNDVQMCSVYDNFGPTGSLDASLDAFILQSPKDIYAMDATLSSVERISTSVCSLTAYIKNQSNITVDIIVELWRARNDIPITTSVTGFPGLLTFGEGTGGGSNISYRQTGWTFFQNSAWCHRLKRIKSARIRLEGGKETQVIMSTKKTRLWDLDNFDFQATPEYLMFKGTKMFTVRALGSAIGDATNAYQIAHAKPDLAILLNKNYSYSYVSDANKTYTFVDHVAAPSITPQTINPETGATENVVSL